MKQYVIDASIAIKWFCEETDRDKALELTRRAEQEEIAIYAPELIVYEVGNVLWKGKKFDARQIMRALFALKKANLEFVSLNESAIERAAGFAVDYDITFYDAAYAALAYELQAPLISENPKDHGKIKEIEVLNLQALEQ